MSAIAPPDRSRILASAVPFAAAAALGSAGPALAGPALPQLPADGAVVGTVRPSISWTAGSSGVPTPFPSGACCALSTGTALTPGA